MDKVCGVPEGCPNPVYGRGMCSKHWQQARKGKRPFLLPSPFLPRTATQEERFWIKVQKTDDCWLWTGAAMANGYGIFDRMLVHRFAYEHIIGPIPDGLEIDHLCYVRNCVRPEHLEAVTRADNIRRQRINGVPRNIKTHCKQGHPFDDENTGWLASGLRYCKPCARAATARHRGGQTPRQPVTHCKHGHEFDEANTRIRANGSKSCRTCAREKQHGYRHNGEAYSPPQPATHCKHGHPFDKENTTIRPDGTRFCRACGRERSRRFRAKKRVDS